jgi:hypothetical protein
MEKVRRDSLTEISMMDNIIAVSLMGKDFIIGRMAMNTEEISRMGREMVLEFGRAKRRTKFMKGNIRMIKRMGKVSCAGVMD